MKQHSNSLLNVRPRAPRQVGEIIAQVFKDFRADRARDERAKAAMLRAGEEQRLKAEGMPS